MVRPAGIILVAALAISIVAPPLGTFWHVAHEHLGHQRHEGQDNLVTVQHDDVLPAPDHAADRRHAWTSPAAPLATAELHEPRLSAALEPDAGASWPSAPPLPPFAPPRA